MDDIPGEKMFGQLPEQASKEGRLKGGFEVDPLMRDDFVRFPIIFGSNAGATSLK